MTARTLVMTQGWEISVQQREELYRQFEQLVIELFRAYDLLPHVPTVAGRVQADRVVINSEGVTAVVEIKFYQSIRVSLSTLQQAFNVVESHRRDAALDRGVLVTNARVSAIERHEAPSTLTIWDFDAISFLVDRRADLSEQWARIIRESFIFRSDALPEPKTLSEVPFLTLGHPVPGAVPILPRRPSIGRDICAALRATKAGRGQRAVQFEARCVEAVKYLFKDDIVNWAIQQNTHESLHRYDLVGRVSAGNDFWNALINDHRARYIIFEFKNYGKKITQKEIYSTEKYLYPRAMRSTSVIVSRKGTDKNAQKVIRGAFREAGKLILSVDLAQLCEMLHEKDAGNDPSGILSGVVEAIMIGLER